MRLIRATLPFALREVEGNESMSYRSRLVMWEALPGATEEHDGAMVTTLVPFKVCIGIFIVLQVRKADIAFPGQTENASLDLLLSPGLTYAFEVAAGGGYVPRHHHPVRFL